jgi:nucleotide-binding universal stress UspA family protein
MYDNVLVPTDGSQGAEGAIARALDLARGERLLGSTTARVVRRSAVPVLTLRG